MFILVCRQVCVTLTSDTVPRHVLSTIACELFKNEISWGRIISLYCVAGGLAVDCLRQGHPEYLIALIETMGAIVERDLAQWIVAQGGWVSFISTIHRFKLNPVPTSPFLAGRRCVETLREKPVLSH